MATVDKLLVQLYERKHSIIELVKKQTGLYDQHLASKLLIDGITPPSWLWDPNSSGSKEPNEEDLIYSLLPPYPQSAACFPIADYPGFNNLVSTGDNEEFSDGNFVENSALSIDLERKRDPTPLAFSGQDHRECLLNIGPELDQSVASPGHETDGKILNIYTAPEQSLAGIQRSKSRQKALELRSSAKALAKSGLRHESKSDVVSRFSLPITDQPGQNDEPSQLAEPCVSGRQSCEDRNVVEACCFSGEKGADSERITRSAGSDKGSLPLGYSTENYKENASSQDARSRRLEPITLSNSKHADSHVKNSAKSVVPSAVRCQSFTDIGGSVVKVNLSNARKEGCDAREPALEDSGRHIEIDTFASSSSIQRNACSNGISDPELEGPSVSANGRVVALSSSSSARQVDDSEKRHGLFKTSVGLFRRLTRSQTRSYVKETYNPVTDNEKPSLEGTQSISDSEEKSAEELQATSSGQSVPPCLGTHNMLHDDKDGKLDQVDQSCLSTSNNSKQRRGLESKVALTPSDCFVPVDSNQLDFKESEDCILALSSRSGNRTPDKLPQKMSCSLHVRDVSPVKEICGENNQPSSSMQQIGMPDVSSEEDKAYRDCLEPYYQESAGKDLGPVVDSAILNASKHSSEAELNYRSSEVSDKVDNMLFENNQPSSRKQLLRMLDVSEEDKANKVSLEPDYQESLEYHANDFGPVVGSAILDASKHSTEAELNCRTSEVLDKADNMLSENNQPSSSKQLNRMSDVSSEEDKAYEVTLEPDYQERNLGPVVGSGILTVSIDSTEAEGNCRSSEFPEKADNVLSEKVDITHPQIHPAKLHLGDVLDFSPVHCMEQGDFSAEGRDKGQSVSSFQESKSARLSFGHSSAKALVPQTSDCLIAAAGTNPITINEIKQDSAQQSRILSCVEGEVSSKHGDSCHGNNSSGRPNTVGQAHSVTNASPQRSFTHARIESWPQAKRRKIELQQAHSFTPSQSFQVTKHQSFQRDPHVYPKTMEIDADSGLMEHVNKNMDDGICSEVNAYRMEGIQSAVLSEHEEDGSCYIKKNERINTSPVINNEELAATISDSAMKESRNSERCFIEGTRTSPSSCDYLDARASEGQHLCNLDNEIDNLNSENLDLSSTLHKELQQFPEWDNGLYMQHSVLSSSNEDQQLTDVDQSMPVYEGFNVNTLTDTGGMDFAADRFDLGELELPRATLERASILAEICRSATLDKHSSHFSSAFKFQEFGNIYPLNRDVGIYSQSHSKSSLDDCKDALDGMPYSVSQAYSGERYGWKSRNQPLSPVRKLWDQLSSHSGSSGKCSTSNPELTCFPIEEDPSSSEDNQIMEDNAGDAQDETDSSLANHSDKRPPLKDLTNMDKNPPMLVSAEEAASGADCVDFLGSKFSVTGTEEEAKYQCGEKNETSKKQTSLTGTAAGRKHQFSSIAPSTIKKAKRSVNNSSIKPMRKIICKPNRSVKTSLQGKDQKLSLKESRRNNIVSNVSSFIPLVQQKQAATECTGKRDVKVKALEAAEAAKRLEERKENERKMRKEALKLERAKLEEKNLRDMELDKKKKDDERKKKDADIIAKKRLREEEERKEREKKKMRIEARQRQREQEEKKRKERPEKENQRTKGDQIHSKKEVNNESKRPQNKETTNGEGTVLTETNSTLNKAVVNHEECSSSGLTCEAGEVMHAVYKSPRKEDLIVQNCKGNSYEISPYQCSDDEDEEEELPTKKYIPSWASKSSIPLYLPLQQDLDPDAIFCPEKNYSMDEVLLPRKLQQKQVVT